MIDAWSGLPEPIRRAVMALVDSVTNVTVTETLSKPGNGASISDGDTDELGATAGEGGAQ